MTANSDTDVRGPADVNAACSDVCRHAGTIPGFAKCNACLRVDWSRINGTYSELRCCSLGVSFMVGKSLGPKGSPQQDYLRSGGFGHVGRTTGNQIFEAEFSPLCHRSNLPHARRIRTHLHSNPKSCQALQSPGMLTRLLTRAGSQL